MLTKTPLVICLTAVVLLCASHGRTSAEPGPGLGGRIAYYPSYDTLELRTSALMFLTRDGRPGLHGAYFDNSDLEGDPAFVRVDKNPGGNWGTAAPSSSDGASLPKEAFSIRWTGRIASPSRSGVFELTVNHDDGMRVWLDGEQLVNSWGNSGGSSRRIRLEKGASPEIRIEYRETGGGARAHINLRPLALLPNDLFRIGEDEAGFKAEYFGGPNLEGEPVTTRTVPRALYHDYRAPGVANKTFSVRWTSRFGPAPTTGTYLFDLTHNDGVRLWVDGKRLVDRWSKGSDDTTVRLELEKGQTVPVRLEMNQVPHGPVTMSMEVRRALEEAYPDVPGRVEILDAAGTKLQTHPVNLPRWGGRRFVEIDPLSPGMHTVRVTSDAFQGEVTADILEQEFAWEGNTLGITDEIFPPFEPLAVEDDTVAVVLRRYRLGGLGLPDQIEARDQDEGSVYKPLLAAPVSLMVNATDRLSGVGGFASTTDAEAVYEGRASHPAVRVDSRVVTEFDGCIKVDLTLHPGETGDTLSSLTLDIPIRNDMAPLYHVVKGAPPIRNNPAGYLPKGEGRIWASTDMRDRHLPGNFKPYIWLGGAARGLAWFADNDKGWVVDWNELPPAQTIHREGDTLTLRVHLVQKPVVIDAPRTLTFGLMASPAKPMPEGWRAIGRPEAPRISFKMGHLFGLNGIYAAKYPRGKDFSPFDKFLAARRGDRVDVNAFTEQWTARHLHDAMEESLRAFFRRSIPNIVNHGRRLQGHDLFTAYYDEFRGTIVWHEEMNSYRSEWTREFETPRPRLRNEWANHPTKFAHLHWFRGTGTAVPSYQDFACYFADIWLRHGVGIYFDNTFMEPSYNLINTSAYVRPDGSIQPSAQIWARRDYLRRIWNLHRQRFDPETAQIMMLHMTNTHVLPYMVWNEANLDLEWKLPGYKPFQQKFRPDLLRAESVGLQTGNIPLAMNKPGKRPANAPGGSDHADALVRTYIYGKLVHEIKYTPNLNSRPYPQPILDFGYGLDECKVVNYWDDDTPVSVSDDACKWMLLQRGEEALLVLCTWNRDASQPTIRLDTAALGFQPVVASDAEHPDASGPAAAGDADKPWSSYDSRKWQGQIQYAPADGELTVPLTSYGVRLIHLKASE